MDDSSDSDIEEESINGMGDYSFPDLPRADPVNQSDLVDYDVERSIEHSYLGSSLERVSGGQWLEEGSTHDLLLLSHCSIVFPGDYVPMMLADIDDLANVPKRDNDGGLIYGLVFPETADRRMFGVTCEVFEMIPSDDGIVRMKSRSKQRFEICRHDNPSWFENDVPQNRLRLIAKVKILPEVLMCDPLFGRETNSLSKFRSNASRLPQLRRMAASSLAWPTFVYDMYDLEKIVLKIKSFLSAMEMRNMPVDLPTLSFWCGKNVLIDAKERMQVFRINSVTERMLLISKSLNYSRYFVCKRCNSKLAHYNSLFAMSSEGFQSTYCNANGYIHETNTVSMTIPNAVFLQGAPTDEFSWFPGYSWQIAMCSNCDTHLGWKFSAPESSNLKPRTFYGLAGRSIALWHSRMSTDPVIEQYSAERRRLQILFN